MVGVAITVMVAVFISVQLLVPPLTVYVEVTVGLCEMLVAFDPVLQVKEAAPFAVRVATFPEQMVAEFTLTVGVVFTVTVAVLMSVQLPEVPVIVYEVVTVGLWLMLAVFAPVFQV